MSIDQQKSLTLMEQVQRYWTIIVSIAAVGLGMQVQIIKNAQNIDMLMKVNDMRSPTQQEILRTTAELQKDIKYIILRVEMNGDRIEKVSNELDEYKETTEKDIREFYRRNPDL